ncbi:VF530 family protein [Thiomicrorhabdus chilensis]|uniref:VF530 family protein n=1 Tax=Thiomicrorhabdus chilensis TaxID=63656 RepID=UPI00041BB880|nr:VF530 family protein [Thiomicrorhabdus chilensis]
MTKTQTPKTAPKPDLAHTKKQPNNPLHGLSLKEIVSQLHAHYGWEELAERIPIRCFQYDPSLKSSLTFLRKTPWAREKVEQLYIEASQNWGKYKRPASTEAKK